MRPPPTPASRRRRWERPTRPSKSPTAGPRRSTRTSTLRPRSTPRVRTLASRAGRTVICAPGNVSRTPPWRTAVPAAALVLRRPAASRAATVSPAWFPARPERSCAWAHACRSPRRAVVTVLPECMLCNDSCFSDKDVASCGVSCTVCPAPANGVAICDGTRCGAVCSAGFHLCAGDCVPNDSVFSCGLSCAACPVPPGGFATCDGLVCGIEMPHPG